MGPKNLKQQILLPGEPHDVYQAILDPTAHSAFTHSAADIDARVGGAFHHYDGSLSGVIVDLEPDRKIVLAWRASGWAKGHYSIAAFSMKKFRKGTKLTFEQFGIPPVYYKGIADGWKTYYWKPLKNYLGAH